LAKTTITRFDRWLMSDDAMFQQLGSKSSLWHTRVAILGVEMATFVKPTGTNFRSADEVPSSVLSKSLCLVVNFLQSVDPYAELQWYLDLWEHSGAGAHVHKQQIDFHGLFKIIGSPRDLLYRMTTDDDVFIGIAPTDNTWYLRFYLNWDEDGFNLIGRFDITLSHELATRFRDEVVKSLPAQLSEQDSQTYYASIS
jgi:hypothetical protein